MEGIVTVLLRGHEVHGTCVTYAHLDCIYWCTHMLYVIPSLHLSSQGEGERGGMLNPQHGVHRGICNCGREE